MALPIHEAQVRFQEADLHDSGPEQQQAPEDDQRRHRDALQSGKKPPFMTSCLGLRLIWNPNAVVVRFPAYLD